MAALQSERLDQHAHAARRPSAGDGKRDAGVSQRGGRSHCRLGQHLVVGDQCAVHIGQQKTDVAFARSWLLLRRRSTGRQARSVARKQFVGRLRAVAAGGVVGEVGLLRCPGVKHRLHDAPSLLHHVGAHEERRIADHDIVEQRLVADIRLLREPVIVVEVHLHGGEVHHRPATLDLELQGDTLVRRDPQHQPVGPQVSTGVSWNAA